mmetsp:Transcript_12358/g.18112  ORF Transcript_12358/g.18112 Transcript_12358/m.18112 type:complete len:546 (+) Transcript_12358:122-1759(+)|eukprot:CAMPEP_0194226802 /NCGR_PEP_ID=MMETSP0156-20130528/42526_1 /TAXON_ID=33649 /ORGANISM="Thalassionema nitzschioides, Strain L26-B" /LENGTH=545 /DNA_ID=CAMNT_0038959261 /DNA_START=46 /DNA_END=1683 /DNA_ORIENTATION=+
MAPQINIRLQTGPLKIGFRDYNGVTTITRVDKNSPVAHHVKEGFQVVSLELSNGKIHKDMSSRDFAKVLKETSEMPNRRMIFSMTLPRKKVLKIYPGEHDLMFEEKNKSSVLVGCMPDSYYKDEVQVGMFVQSIELLNGDKITCPSFSEVRNLLARFKLITRVLTLVRPDKFIDERSIKGRFMNQPDEKIPLEHWVDNLEEWFKYYDKDRSRALSKQEVIDGLTDTFEVMPEKKANIHKYVDSMWSEFDPDGSNSIDMNEFCSTTGLGYALQGQLYAEMGPPPIQELSPEGENDEGDDGDGEKEYSANPLEFWYNNLSDWFHFYDKDKSNALSKQEVIDALTETFASSTEPTNDIPTTVESVWNMFDLDNDGTIDENEFAAYGGLGENLQAQLQEEMTKEEEMTKAMMTKAKKNVDKLEYWRNHLPLWFKNYDVDFSKSLTREEVSDALVDTFDSIPETNNVPDLVNSLWDLYDHDGSGAIDEDEFVAESGLGNHLRRLLASELGLGADDQQDNEDDDEPLPKKASVSAHTPPGDYSKFAIYYDQ